MVTSINADLWQAVQQFLTGRFTPLDLQERLRLLQEETSRLQRALDLVSLRQAFEAVIERHIADL